MSETVSNEIARQRLNAWAEENGYDYKILAERLNYTRSAMHRIMSGSRDVSSDFAWRFADVFGYELAVELFGRPVEVPA